jgi:hypothetical protein
MAPMRRGLLIGCVLAAALATAPAALATSQTAHSGNVTATFTFKGKYPSYSGQRIAIALAGNVLYDQPVVSQLCGTQCAPGSLSASQPSVHLVDLEHDGQPDVVLDLYSGGAHCCVIEQIFSLDPGTMTYVKSEHVFGDPGDRIVDLGHDGRFEFLTADDVFAYAFTDYAASGLPIQILTFSGGDFQNVTGSYPKLIAKDAAVWLKAFKSSSKDHWQDTVGVIAAWAADEDMLGHGKLVSRYLAQQSNAGHLNGALGNGRKFVAHLQRFLRAHGYLG